MKLVTASMSGKELREIIEDCQAELDFRRDEEKRKLIADFENAFFALKNANIKIRYTDDEQEAWRILLNDVECFDFE